jgi:hypothetical protein
MIATTPLRHLRARVLPALLLSLAACTSGTDGAPAPDLILHNARVYTLAWREPATDGRPSAQAPYDSINGWHHDASAVVVREGRIVFVGSDSAALARKGPETRVIDLKGGVLLPGLSMRTRMSPSSGSRSIA